MAIPASTKPFAAFEWLLALRYLRARRKEGFISVISLFSFLGIMLGVATLIVVMSVFNGFHQELLGKILGFSGHAAVYRNDQNPISDYKNIAARVAKVDGVTQVIALAEGQGMVSSVRNATGALVRGIAEADLAKLPDIANKDLKTAIAAPERPAKRTSRCARTAYSLTIAAFPRISPPTRMNAVALIRLTATHTRRTAPSRMTRAAASSWSTTRSSTACAPRPCRPTRCARHRRSVVAASTDAPMRAVEGVAQVAQGVVEQLLVAHHIGSGQSLGRCRK